MKALFTNKFDANSIAMYFQNSSAIHFEYYSINRLVVLTTEWLPAVTGLMLVSEANCINNYRGSFLVVSSSFPCSSMRKQQGNWLLYTVRWLFFSA